MNISFDTLNFLYGSFIKRCVYGVYQNCEIFLLNDKKFVSTTLDEIYLLITQVLKFKVQVLKLKDNN